MIDCSCGGETIAHGLACSGLGNRMQRPPGGTLTRHETRYAGKVIGQNMLRTALNGLLPAVQVV